MRAFPDDTPDDIRAVLERCLPEDGICEGYMILASYTELVDGDRRRLTVTNMETPVSETIGLLELAKMEIWQRSVGSDDG